MRLSHELAFQPHKLFQFTHPGRGATPQARADIIRQVVSIHAPREGCDALFCESSRNNLWFQFTHPGRGATEMDYKKAQTRYMFQFTHPGRGATPFLDIRLIAKHVSIHAPREGCDDNDEQKDHCYE